MNIKTMSDNVEAEMESLFQEWEAAHKRKGYERFIRDGIVSLEDWYGQPTPKICYLLKEAYSNDAGYDLAKKLNISPLLASILLSRGIDSREKGELFLHPERIEYCDPYLLPDMRLAVDRIILAISKGERITVYGDYDAE